MNFTSEIEELIYNEYLEIPVSDYHGKTHYFERNIREINQLPFDLSIEIRCACVIAYFELGLYYKYLNQVDDLIHLVITENIYELNGKNIFEELLFRKGASAYNVVDYYKAKYIFSELIKIDSSNALYQTAFTRCNVDKLRYEGQNFRGITICLLILAAAVIAFELLSIRPFHEQYISLVETIRNVIFGIALGSFFFQELRIRYLNNKHITVLTNNK